MACRGTVSTAPQTRSAETRRRAGSTPFFRRFYAETASGLVGLEAREHTAQVTAELRQDREDRFSDAALPVLYCSPTMELGVDIKSLNVVGGMRNVPPRRPPTTRNAPGAQAGAVSLPSS